MDGEQRKDSVMDIKNILEQKLGKSIADSSKQEIYVALLNIAKEILKLFKVFKMETTTILI